MKILKYNLNNIVETINLNSGDTVVFVPDNASVDTYAVPVTPFLTGTDIPYVHKIQDPWTYWDVNTKLASIRLQRDFLIAQSDWRVIKATETNTPEDQAWKNYRQALRDFPNLVNVNLPIEQIVWPQPPS